MDADHSTANSNESSPELERVFRELLAAEGLRFAVWQSIQRLEAGAGFEAGIGIVIVAVILDRATQALAARARPHGVA